MSVTSAAWPPLGEPFGRTGVRAGLAVLRGLISEMGATRTRPRPRPTPHAEPGPTHVTHPAADDTPTARIERYREPGAPVSPSPGGPGPNPTGYRRPEPGPGAQPPEPPDRMPDQVPESATEVWRLVQRAQAGDVEAFGALYDRYADTVFRFVYFRVSTRQLAEDLTSETFLRALRRINSFTWQGRDLGAWLVTIARNLVADHFKSGRYRLEVSTAEVLDADRPDRDPEGSPEAAVLDKLTNQTLLEAVKRLNPEQQECIVLRFLQGFSVAETAQAMSKNEGAIKALQYRAVRSLARLLPEDFTP